MIYFDHNATTPLDERVLEAMLPYLSRFHGNPSSLYKLGRLARSGLDTAREQVAALVGASPGQIVFTSGGTEANNLAVKGLGFRLARGAAVMGATEHPAVTEPMAFLQAQGWLIEKLAVDSEGLIPLHSVQDQAARALFASVMWANNETGVIQPIPAIAAELREAGTIVHCDATQAAGKIPVDFAASNVQLMSLSSHKIYGPKGAGALVVDRSVALVPQVQGGGQERDLRGGTENVAAIVGFGKAAELASSELEERRVHQLALRHRLEARLAALPGVTIFAQQVERLPNTVLFSLADFDGETLVMLFDREGFAISSGSACASSGKAPSPVLLAMGVDPSTARGAVRVSLGWSNTEQDIERFLGVLEGLPAEMDQPVRRVAGARC
jgi:cysteine desulfurase